ncbi:MFS transporter [Roseomonas marmotae]|uniref:MFS transporter n=1 Tax=Roseomonas marmotae TaxID=2768161 RepID=A0ABS3KG57_9PROT|nr:MFS transporter [Roseomonas marmotae]MBO1076451.1 MFS transporter [Roseomonas marmotae]QTI77947.1 MFS transporter [Roseomonas marmotae]
MDMARRRPFGQKYAFVVLGVTFVALLAAAGLRATPGVLILPLEEAFGWGRSTTALSAGIGIFLYGMVGPFAAALMASFGLRRTVLGALALMTASTFASSFMSEPWHLILSWGVFSGIGSGAVAMVLGATITNRWFTTHRGLVMGVLTASTATGSLVFLPLLASLAEAGGWRPVVLTVSAAIAAVIPLVWWLVPERPGSIGLVPYGAAPGTPPPPPPQGMLAAAFGSLSRAARTRSFWYLFATFYICGFTTNGLVGTHLIALCSDMGIPEVRAASLLALMGIFDLIGTTLSGWLTDRYDPRKLLFVYYGLRGLSLIYLPYSDFSLYSLTFFAVFYGLDWIATVPPTLRLATEAFGERDAPVVFGWIAAGHQIGAASAALLGGLLRDTQGSYLEMFILAGMTGLVAAGLSLAIRRHRVVAVPA